MKRFICRTILLAIIYLVCVIAIRVVWFTFITPLNTYHIDFTPEQHIMLLGPSNGGYAWNDALTPSVKNLCTSASTFEDTYYKTRYIFEHTTFHPDTVILFATPVTMIYNHDKMWLNMTYAGAWLLRERRSNLYWHEFVRHHISEASYRKTIIKHFGKPWKTAYDIGGYTYNPTSLHLVDNAYVNSPYQENLVQIGGYDAMNEQNLREKCATQVEYLYKLQDYLSQHNCQVVIMATPLKEIQSHYCDRGFRNLLAAIFPPDTPVADYTNMPLPDEYYGDWVHLNYLGADYFTHHIIDHGIETVPLSQWQAEANCP